MVLPSVVKSRSGCVLLETEASEQPLRCEHLDISAAFPVQRSNCRESHSTIPGKAENIPTCLQLRSTLYALYAVCAMCNSSAVSTCRLT